MKQLMLTVHHASKSFPKSWPYSLNLCRNDFHRYMLARLQAVRYFLHKYASENVLFITPTELPVRMEAKQAAPSMGEEGLVNLPAPCHQAVTSWCNPAQL